MRVLSDGGVLTASLAQVEIDPIGVMFQALALGCVLLLEVSHLLLML